MVVDMTNESLYSLAVKCSQRQLSSGEFLNLYKEFYNEKLASEAGSVDDDSEPPSNAESKTTATTICTQMAQEFTKIFKEQHNLILIDYLIEILFVNYNPDLIHLFLPLLKTVSTGDGNNDNLLIHFLSKLSAYFVQLRDKLVGDQLVKDLPGVIIPNLLEIQYGNNNELSVALAKCLLVLLKYPSNVLTIESVSCRDNAHHLLSKLSDISRLVYKKLLHTLDNKVNFKDSNGLTKDVSGQEPSSIYSPSITSPQFISSPLFSMKTPSLPNNKDGTVSTMKYKDMKLFRYYKNIWLNNKIMNWEMIGSEFLSKYNSISSTLFPESADGNHVTVPNVDMLLIDLIETSFTCFAQYVSNKQYHRTNSNLNLLERQWIIFISKHLPILLLNHSSKNPQIVTTALEQIDPKVIKAITSYYSEKDDMRVRNDDLFDDFSSTSFDVRHDFIKSLVSLGLQPPTLINEFLREDQAVDPKSLPVTDDLVITTSQGTQETVGDIQSFIISSLDSLELENICSDDVNSESDIPHSNVRSSISGDSFNGIHQILQNNETIPPTKMKEISTVIFELLKDAIAVGNHSRISKICALLCFNFNHSLIAFFSFQSPQGIIEDLLHFVDKVWPNSSHSSKDDNTAPDESNDLFLSFSWALLLLTSINKNIGISLVDVALKSSLDIPLEDSFTIKFIDQLTEIPDDYSIEPQNRTLPEVQTQSHKLVRNWLSDLFINGSLSDQLTQNTDAKQLATLLPFILKQVLYALECNVVTDMNNVIGGFEYFLQPFMIVGLIKIVFWLEKYLSYLNNEPELVELTQKVLVIMNSLLNPTTLNEDSRTFHCAALRLNAIPLLKMLRKFCVPQTQTEYGVYSSDTQEPPMVESLIKKLISVINFAPVYNMDPRIVSTDNIYLQQKPIGYGKLQILNENPIDKIMTNQINSFWNLHSSTYYNIDFLNEIIKLITPKKFFFDVLNTLTYKISVYGVPAARNKMSTVDSDHVIDYLFYFLVLHDCESQVDAGYMVQLLSGNLEIDNSAIKPKKDLVKAKEQPADDLVGVPKSEIAQDDDFVMLFGENDTSSHNMNDDMQDVHFESSEDDEVKKLQKFYALKKDSFGVILYQLKLVHDAAVKDGDLSKTEYEKFNKHYEKYLSMLKTFIF